MQGLLDIWNNYWDRPEPSGSGTTFDDEWKKKKLRRGQSERSNLNTAGGVPTGNIVPRQHVGRGQTVNQGIPSHEDPNYVPKNRLGKEYPEASAADIAAGKTIQLASGKHIVSPGKQAQVLAQSATKTPKQGIPFHPSQGGDLKHHGGDQQDQLKWWQQLSSKMGLDFDKAAANWKDKGGFEGLMANPAFTMGLAFMQAGAEGKSIGQGALDNVMKAAGISSHYKKILKDRKEAPIEVTSTDIGEVKSLLQSMNISSPSNLEKFWGFVKGEKNMQMKWDLAAEDIAVELQKEIKKLQNNKKPGDPVVVYDTKMKMKILKRMLDEGRFKKKGGTWFTDATLQTTNEIPKLERKAEGGPVQAGKPYIVGEKGPEVIIPKSDGNVLANDDSQIFAMLLASNPQLQNVSRQRAERILRSRFPEYFEV